MSTLKQLVDETTNIKNEIISCHSNLVYNLQYVDVECNNNDKLNILIDKVRTVNTGKKWASGTFYNISSTSATKRFYYLGGSTAEARYITITFPFTPSNAILSFSTSTTQYGVLMSNMDGEYTPFCCIHSDSDGSNGSPSRGYQIDSCITTDNITYDIPIYAPLSAMSVNWIIFE